MVKYRVIVDKDRCIGCGIAMGRCPTHVKLLSQLLNKDPESMSMGFLSEDLYNRVKELVAMCSEKAIIIEKIAE